MAVDPNTFCDPDNNPEQGSRPTADSVEPNGRDSSGLEYSSLCSFGLQRFLITGLIVDFLRQQFQLENLVNPMLERFVWRASPDTGISIESWSRETPEKVGKTPALVVRPNQMQNQKVFIGNRVGHVRPGGTIKETTWIGSHTVFAISRSGVATDFLAGEANDALLMFEEPLKLSIQGLKRFDVIDMGPPSEIEEVAESYAIPITVGWVYSRAWLLEQERPKLARITQEINLS